VNSLPKTVTRQRRGCDFNPGPSASESSTLTTRLPSHLWLTRRKMAADKLCYHHWGAMSIRPGPAVGRELGAWRESLELSTFHARVVRCTGPAVAGC